MIAVATQTSRPTFNLEGTRLLVPSVQSDPLAIRRVEDSPCMQACPAGINVKAYVSLIAERRFVDALEIVRQRCPLPGICGRVCHHPCESECLRARYDDPVAIRALKRFAADLEAELPQPEPPPPPHKTAKVAVIGSGPAGLTAAHDLRLSGYAVTVFEAEKKAGGMLRYGIAAYRLPRDILDREIEVLARTGVEIRTGVRVGVDLTWEELTEEYDAVLLGVGAQVGRRLGIPGEERRPEIEDALAFLRRVNDGTQSVLSGKIVVVGGGSTAIEAARCALRLGADAVEIVYRRSREQMPASEAEIEDSEREGVRLRYLVAPARVLTESGRLAGLECLQVALGEPDKSGRRRPITIPGTEFTVEADHILAAIGQQADLGFLPEDARSQVVERDLVQTDPQTSMSPVVGWFAAGDVVTGPATVVEAIAAGHRAAESILNYLEQGTPGEVKSTLPGTRPAEYELADAPAVSGHRIKPQMQDPQPGHLFEEVEQALSTDQAVAEAQRCLRCGPCGECQTCASSCRRRHVMIGVPGGEDGVYSRTIMVRAAGSFARALNPDQPTPAWLVPDNGTSYGAAEAADKTAVEVVPAQVRIHERRCRGCGTCVETCAFDALSLQNDADGAPKSHLDPALCRGCNVCVAVCPSRALESTTMSPAWWAARLQDVERFTASENAPALPAVVLACERRAGSIDPMLQYNRAEVIRLRCVGQVDAGMILDLYQRRARRIIIAGCHGSRCRYGSGPELAAQQAQQATGVIRLLGGYEDCVVLDHSSNWEEDPLEIALQRHRLSSGAAVETGHG